MVFQNQGYLFRRRQDRGHSILGFRLLSPMIVLCEHSMSIIQISTAA